ncbi:MAG: hypothetical protein HY819_13760 [Acidobacteria bacterium]|nr:hypothetical protein [Acidobacteriota bacterium]
MQKVLIIGSGGSGKSTLARKLATILKIELIHLDLLYWKAGWIETPKEKWREIVLDLLKKDSWVIDGNYSGTLKDRIEVSDTIIFLDRSPLLCLWRVLKRWFYNRNKNRIDMPMGCNEQLSLEFMFWILNYPQKTKPTIINLLKENTEGKQVFHLRSNTDVENFLLNCKNLTQPN